MIARLLPFALLLAPTLFAQNATESVRLPNPSVILADAAGKVPPRPEQNDYRMLHNQVQTFYLQNVPEPNDANEILTGLRLILDPSIKLYLLPSQRAITISALPEELKLVGELIQQWERPRHAYRLTYTITEFDGATRIGMQHSAVEVVEGARATLKNGSKIPVATGSYNPGSATGAPNTGVQTQFTYLDVGLNLDMTLEETAAGARLKCKIEQSSVAPDQKSIAGVDEPVIRQTVLESQSLITPGKPNRIGSIDVFGSTRRLDIEVTMEQIR